MNIIFTISNIQLTIIFSCHCTVTACCRQSCLKWVYKASGRRKEFLPSRKRCSTGFFRKGYSVWNRMLENPVKIDPILIPSLCSTALTKVLRIKGWTESDQSRGGGGFRGVGVGVGAAVFDSTSVGKKGREKNPASVITGQTRSRNWNHG